MPLLPAISSASTSCSSLSPQGKQIPIPLPTINHSSRPSNDFSTNKNPVPHRSSQCSNDLTPIPKDLSFRHMKDIRSSRFLGVDPAVLAMFSNKSNNKDMLSLKSQVAEQASDPPQSTTTTTTAFGTRKEELGLERAKEIALTKVRIQNTRLFQKLYPTIEFNMFLEKAIQYIGKYLKLAELEEWRKTKTGQSKLPSFLQSFANTAEDTTAEARLEKDIAIKELGVRYSLLLIAVGKVRSGPVERACFEAIYKMTNAVARIYFPIKSKWEAIGDELDTLFRGAHFHHRPEKLDMVTWESRAGPRLERPIIFSSESSSSKPVSSTREGEETFSMSRFRNLENSGTAAFSNEPNPPPIDPQRDAGSGNPGKSSVEGEEDETSDRTKEEPKTWGPEGKDSVAPEHADPLVPKFAVPRRHLHPRHPASHPFQIYKSLHSRTLFIEGIIPSSSEAAKAFSQQEHERILGLHREHPVVDQRRNSHRHAR